MPHQLVNYGPQGTDASFEVTAEKTAAYTAKLGEMVLVNTTGGVVVVTLPSANMIGQVAVRLNTGTVNAVTITPYGTDTIDGAASASVGVVGSVRILTTNGDGKWFTTNEAPSSTALDARYQRVAGTVNTVAASGAAQTIPDPAVSAYNDITLTANCTFTLPAVTVGKHIVFKLTQDGTGTRLVTWPAGTIKANGFALTATAGATDLVEATSIVTGVWMVNAIGLNYA
jgi:hypothetical protein